MGRVELIEYLFKLSEGKLFLINQLWTLTQQQSETIDSGEMDSLNDIIEQKQSIMDRVDVLDKEFAEKYDVIKAEFPINDVGALDSESREKMRMLKEKVKEIHNLTEKIQQMDDSNTERFQKNMESIRNELKKVKFGQKISKGYSVNKQNEGFSIFIDKMK